MVIIIESAKFDPKSTELPYDVCYNVMAAVVEVNLAVFSGKAPSNEVSILHRSLIQSQDVFRFSGPFSVKWLLDFRQAQASIATPCRVAIRPHDTL